MAQYDPVAQQGRVDDCSEGVTIETLEIGGRRDARLHQTTRLPRLNKSGLLFVGLVIVCVVVITISTRVSSQSSDARKSSEEQDTAVLNRSSGRSWARVPSGPSIAQKQSQEQGTGVSSQSGDPLSQKQDVLSATSKLQSAEEMMSNWPKCKADAPTEALMAWCILDRSIGVSSLSPSAPDYDHCENEKDWQSHEPDGPCYSGGAVDLIPDVHACCVDPEQQKRANCNLDTVDDDKEAPKDCFVTMCYDGVKALETALTNGDDSIVNLFDACKVKNKKSTCKKLESLVTRFALEMRSLGMDILASKSVSPCVFEEEDGPD